nr:MAG TPA: hypothetical protein [Caudoviricetes sp.]
MKKLIVEIDDKYADAVSMTATGLEHRLGGGVNLTVAAFALNHDVTAIFIDSNGIERVIESKLEDAEHIPLEKLQRAVRQLKDLRNDREGFADYDEEDNAFVRDIEAIDTAIAAMQQLAALDIAGNR